MDVNSALLQIPSPAAASSSDGAASTSQTGKSQNAGGTKKSFASVLRTVQQGDEKGRPQQSDDAEPRRATKSGADPDRVQGVSDDAPPSGEIKSRGLAVEKERLSQNQTDESDEGEGDSQEGWAAQANVSAVSAELLRALGQAVSSQSPRESLTDLPQGDPLLGSMEDDILASSQKNAMTGSTVTPVLLPPELTKPFLESEAANQAAAPSQGETVTVAKPSHTAPEAQPLWGTGASPSGQPVDPMAEPVSKAFDHETGEQGGKPAQEHPQQGQYAFIQPLTEGGDQASHVPQELSRPDTVGPHPVRAVDPLLQEKQVEGGVQLLAEPRPQVFPHEGAGDERAEKPVAPTLHTPQMMPESGRPSDLLWPNQDDRQPASDQTPWGSHPPLAPSQSDVPGDHPAQSVTIGSAASPQPRPVESLPAPPAGHVPSATPAHDIEPFVPAMSRSVAFEVAEPDLGRVSIRVAMTNELVHAHLSSDRSEVGQFLINGQDRLQAALQTNGLEMGQFRVDIDRQSTGRSFQQGPPHDQSRMWQQASTGGQRDHGPLDWHDDAGRSHAGRLNLVA